MNQEKLDIPQHENLVIFGAGHSGTTVLAQVIHALGWNAVDADQAYAESVSVRAMSDKAETNNFDSKEAARILAKLVQPWAIKDPRFAYTMAHWREVFAPYKPTLVWIFRNSSDLERSYKQGDWTQRKAGVVLPPEPIRGNLSIPELQALALRGFHQWPWGKLRIDYDQLVSAASKVRTPEIIRLRQENDRLKQENENLRHQLLEKKH